MTMDQLMFAAQNKERILAVERSFVSSKKPLYKSNRVLIGEGRLRKQRRSGGSRPKAFFLFNDVLVYGTIVVYGKWYKNQKVVDLVNLQVEDVDDGVTMKNQWLMRTPCKSFYVGASSPEEKQAWLKHLESCLSSMQQGSAHGASVDLAVPWVPDHVSDVCMRCPNRFSFTQRRHHCRKCGFVVCGACSKQRAVITHMHPCKMKRVCTTCHSALSTGVHPLRAGSLDSEEEEEVKMNGGGVASEEDSWAVYVYMKPEHIIPTECT
ncbi:pleckstrin homology domain-containing family F member 1 [Gouania willdenowi]|uniref:Pleckstrin homology domain-containing family F member 2-like n=1 Tax=Gouania willdenowi TaxID=441366 RepID=A0A8C5GL10_GOUWI|nr:pleckstrin homology domain-containing family F member 2-like [Gouania willdenowi]